MQRDLDRAKKELFRKIARRIRSEAVIKAMERVPRERFVPIDSRHMAYLDLPLSIGEGQTISQPYIVAMMTAALALLGSESVLEVGTGSGYQAAILSLLLPRGRVTTVELVPSLANRARSLLTDLGYKNIEVRLAGGNLGCPQRGPYDAILVAAAAPKLPDELVAQLAPGGRMVIPVGTLDQQELVECHRTGEGLSFRMLGPCRFVPLLGPGAFPGH